MAEDGVGGANRLRWWEQSESKTSKWYHGAPAALAPKTDVAQAPLDIGEELEREARQRAREEATGARVILPFQHAKYRKAARKRAMALTAVQILAILMQIASGIAAHHFPALIAINILAILFIWRVLMRKGTQDQGPVLVMTDAGLDMGAIGTIYWHEIAEVKRAGSGRRAMAIVVPRDSEAVIGRLQKVRPRSVRVRRRLLISLGRKGSDSIPRGMVVYAVNHEASGLSVDEVVGRVNAFRSARGV